MKKRLIPIIVELVGISAVSAGIGLEIALGGDVYFALITVGSLLITAGGLIFAKFMRGSK